MAGRNHFLNAAYALPILLLYQECYPSPRSTPSQSRSRWPLPPRTTVTPAPGRPRISLISGRKVRVATTTNNNINPSSWQAQNNFGRKVRMATSFKNNSNHSSWQAKNKFSKGQGGQGGNCHQKQQRPKLLFRYESQNIVKQYWFRCLIKKLFE